MYACVYTYMYTSEFTPAVRRLEVTAQTPPHNTILPPTSARTLLQLRPPVPSGACVSGYPVGCVCVCVCVCVFVCECVSV